MKSIHPYFNNIFFLVQNKLFNLNQEHTHKTSMYAKVNLILMNQCFQDQISCIFHLKYLLKICSFNRNRFKTVSSIFSVLSAILFAANKVKKKLYLNNFLNDFSGLYTFFYEFILLWMCAGFVSPDVESWKIIYIFLSKTTTPTTDIFNGTHIFLNVKHFF